METHRLAKRDIHDHQLIETLLMKDVVRSFAWLYPSGCNQSPSSTLILFVSSACGPDRSRAGGTYRIGLVDSV